MSPARRIGGFFLRLCLFYGVLAAPWPGLPETFAAAYRRVGEAVVGVFVTDATVRFEPLAQSGRTADTEIVFEKKSRIVAGAKFQHSARLMGYLPTVEVVALILATPIPWSRKGKALAWGLLLACGLVALRMAIAVWCLAYVADAGLKSSPPDPFWREVVLRTYYLGAVSPIGSFIAPVFIWILVSFRRSDWRTLLL